MKSNSYHFGDFGKGTSGAFAHPQDEPFVPHDSDATIMTIIVSGLGVLLLAGVILTIIGLMR